MENKLGTWGDKGVILVPNVRADRCLTRGWQVWGDGVGFKGRKQGASVSCGVGEVCAQAASLSATGVGGKGLELGRQT